MVERKEEFKHTPKLEPEGESVSEKESCSADGAVSSPRQSGGAGDSERWRQQNGMGTVRGTPSVRGVQFVRHSLVPVSYSLKTASAPFSFGVDLDAQ